MACLRAERAFASLSWPDAEQVADAHWQAALSGNIDSTKVVLQVIDRRAKLFGLNAPTRVAVGPEISAILPSRQRT